jgi:hypothetical protein
MRFDANGQHIKGVHRTTINHNDVVVDLESRYLGISDNAVSSVIQMVHEEKISDFHSILKQIGNLTFE